MPSLHAFFVAINAYPDPHHVLEGCVSDMQQFHDYLAAHCQQLGLTFRPLVLTDQQATRAKLIAGFRHFEAAEAGDQCLFFYAGHGSRSEAPEMFWTLHPDKKMESIVCFDSRQPGGHDLMDKELSYLVWAAMEGKDMPMITITDCCHSGRLRDITETGRVRQIRDVGAALAAAQFWGIDHYQKDDSGQKSPPQGRRVHLAAARDVETAKEVSVGGQSRGIFTYCLVQALQATGPLVSYAELANRVQLRVRANMADQSPQLEATLAADKHLRFLSAASDSGRQPYLLSFNRNIGWTVNAGAIHGLNAGDPDSRTVLELLDDRNPVTVTEVGPGSSRVEGMDGRDQKLVYPAVVVRRAMPKWEMAPAPGSDPAAIVALQQAAAQRPSDIFRIGSENGRADFVIQARDNTLALTRSQDPRPLFQRVQGYDPVAIKAFLAQLEVVANWRQVLELSNPYSSIADGEIVLSLYRIVDPGNLKNDAPVEPVDDHQPVVFAYADKNGQKQQPAFQLKLQNTGHRPLWVSLLYLGFDFSITNQLLPKQLLGPGEEAWAMDVSGGQVYQTIPLQVDPAFLAQGLHAIEEYFKLFICTEELSTDAFNQAGLAPDTGRASLTRGICLREEPKKPDWQARETMVRIVYEP
ncbi:MAG: caspase family protein [Saprospiraceae bacterium]